MSGFRLAGALSLAETIAEGAAIRELPRLIKAYGPGNWKKRKAHGTVELGNGMLRRAELHWYEAH